MILAINTHRTISFNNPFTIALLVDPKTFLIPIDFILSCMVNKVSANNPINEMIIARNAAYEITQKPLSSSL